MLGTFVESSVALNIDSDLSLGITCFFLILVGYCSLSFFRLVFDLGSLLAGDALVSSCTLFSGLLPRDVTV